MSEYTVSIRDMQRRIYDIIRMYVDEKYTVVQNSIIDDADAPYVVIWSNPTIYADTIDCYAERTTTYEIDVYNTYEDVEAINAEELAMKLQQLRIQNMTISEEYDATPKLYVCRISFDIIY